MKDWKQPLISILEDGFREIEDMQGENGARYFELYI